MQKVQTIKYVYRLAGPNSIRPCGELYNRHSVTAKRVKKMETKLLCTYVIVVFAFLFCGQLISKNNLAALAGGAFII